MTLPVKGCHASRSNGVDGWNRGRIQPTRHGRSVSSMTGRRGTTTRVGSISMVDGFGVRRRGVAARGMAEDGKTMENKMMNSSSSSSSQSGEPEDDASSTLYSDERMRKTRRNKEEEGVDGFSSSSSSSSSRGDWGAESNNLELIGQPGRCVVTFRVRKRTKFGQRVVLCGSIPELGLWQVLGGSVRCTSEGDHWWSASVCVDVPPSKILGDASAVCEYNFAIIDDGADPSGAMYSWRSGTSALKLPSYAFDATVMDIWQDDQREYSSLMDVLSRRMNEPALTQVTRYHSGGASKSLKARDTRENVKSEIWFPSDDRAVVVENGSIVEILDNTPADENGSDGLRVGDVYLGVVVGEVPNMKSLIVSVDPEAHNPTRKDRSSSKKVLVRDALASPAAWWRTNAPTVANNANKDDDDADDDGMMELFREVRNSNQTMHERLTKAGKHAYSMYSVGDAILVEVVRERTEYKGAVATAEPSLTGRYTVLKGTASGVSAHSSKKLSVINRDELSELGRGLLKANYSGIRAPERANFHGGGAHLIMRTACLNAPVEALNTEVKALSAQWSSILQRAMKSINKQRAASKPIRPRLLWRDSNDFKGMILRELCSLNISGIVVRDQEMLVKMVKSVSHLREGDDNINTIVRLGSQQRLKKLMDITFSERVPIPHTTSAELVIESTEALTAIDVNTGSSRLSVAEINVMAARTAAAELRRRNISGIIVIDFVNVSDPQIRDRVYRQIEAEFADAAARDRAKVSFTPISFVGLMEITREHMAYGPVLETSDKKSKNGKSSASKWLERRTR
jgi:Rne/Rng family ribonuclease